MPTVRRPDGGADRGRIDEARRRPPRRRTSACAPEVQDRVRRGGERHGRRDDLVAGADVERAQREEQAHRARVRADDVRRRRVARPRTRNRPSSCSKAATCGPSVRKSVSSTRRHDGGLVLAELVPVELDLAGFAASTSGALRFAARRGVRSLPSSDRSRWARSASRRKTYWRSVYQRRSSGSTAPSRRAPSTSRMPSSMALLGREAEDALDLVEGDVVVAQIGVGGGVDDLGAGHGVAHAEGEVQDLHVARVGSDVEHLAGDLARRRLVSASSKARATSRTWTKGRHWRPPPSTTMRRLT